jgi:hypothetical protein
MPCEKCLNKFVKMKEYDMSQKLVYVKKKKIKGKRSEGKRFPHSS